MKLYSNQKAVQSILYTLIIVFIVILFNRYIYDGTEYLKSNIDGQYYKVRSGNFRERKADLLAMLNIKFGILVSALKSDPRYKNDTDVKRLIINWDRGISIKEIGNMENDAAYVINKQDMSFCLQDSPNPGNIVKGLSIEDTNLVTYVGIHELAHVMSYSTDHGSEFIKNFQFLLNYSKNLTYRDPFTNEEEPIYIQLNELNTADNYCGVPLVNSIN
jgi:hypothetical protein